MGDPCVAYFLAYELFLTSIPSLSCSHQLQIRFNFLHCLGIRHATMLQEALHNDSNLTPEILRFPLTKFAHSAFDTTLGIHV